MTGGTRSHRWVLGRLGVWLDAVALWAILLVLAGVQVLVRDDWSWPGRFRWAGILLAYPVVLALVRAAWPVRTKPRDPRVLLAGGRSWLVHTVSGTAHLAGADVAAMVPTIPHPRRSPERRRRPVPREHRLIRGRLRVHTPDGQTHDVRVRHALVAIDDGDVVTVAWVSAPGRRGRDVAVVNHTLATTTWLVRGGLGAVIRGGRVAPGVAWMVVDNALFVLGGAPVGYVLFVVELVLLAVIVRAQVAWFRSRTSAPLLALIQAEGSPPPVPEIPHQAGPPARPGLLRPQSRRSGRPTHHWKSGRRHE